MKTGFRVLSACVALFLARLSFGEQPIFEDNFKDKLSDKWQVVGLKDTDYRIKDGKLTKQTPMLKVILPFHASETVTVSVKVTPLKEFTQDGELAGVYLIDETGYEFGAKKLREDGKLIYSPGEGIFKGKPGEEGDFKKYQTITVKESAEAGPLRIIVDQGYAFFQVGPSSKGTYHNHFYSAIRKKTMERGFALTACGAPDGEEHWVRFENFLVERR